MSADVSKFVRLHSVTDYVYNKKLKVKKPSFEVAAVVVAILLLKITITAIF